MTGFACIQGSVSQDTSFVTGDKLVLESHCSARLKLASRMGDMGKRAYKSKVRTSLWFR